MAGMANRQTNLRSDDIFAIKSKGAGLRACPSRVDWLEQRFPWIHVIFSTLIGVVYPQVFPVEARIFSVFSRLTTRALDRIK